MRNNKFIRIEKKLLYNKRLINCNFVTIRDLDDDDGNSIIEQKSRILKISPIDTFLLFQVLSAIPLEWRKKVKEENTLKEFSSFNPKQNLFYVQFGTKKFEVSELKSKELYKRMILAKATQPTATTRYETCFNTEFFKLDWKEIYVLPFKTTQSTKLREFQFKVLNRIVYTNHLLHKIGKVISPLCYFCQSEIETLEHMLFDCRHVNDFWKDIYMLLRNQNIASVPFSKKYVIFGAYELNSNLLLINQIILEGKYYIYCCKMNNCCLSRNIFKKKWKRTFCIEGIIAKENIKLECHYSKWGDFLPFTEDA